MKKKLFFTLSLLFIFLCFNMILLKAKTNEDKIIYERYATIVSANYVNNVLIVKLEIDNHIYNSQFLEELSYEDYQFFHHNEGVTINVTYYLENNQLKIIKWFI